MEFLMKSVNIITMRLTAEQFRTLYLEHGRRAQGFFMRMMGYDVQIARDMVQDLFTRIWEHRDNFRADASFTTWMFSIAYNMCKNEYRHREIVQAYQEHIMATTTEIASDADTLEQQQQRQMLREAINALPDTQKPLFLLRYEEELTVPEIARITMLPEGTVKSRLLSALKSVKESMNKYNL